MHPVAANIKKLRTSKKISQQSLAQKLNVTRQAVSNWENGKSLPDIDMLARIADVLNVEITEIIDCRKPQAEYDRTKKERVVRSVCLTVLLAALIAAALIFVPLLSARKAKFYDSQPLAVFSGVMYPALYAAGAAWVLSFIAIWKDFRIKNRSLKRAFAGSGIVLALLVPLTLSAVLWGNGLYMLPLLLLWKYPQYGILIGIFIFLGFYGKHAVHT